MLDYQTARRLCAFRERVSSETRNLVWALNYLVSCKFTKKVDIPYTKMNFQICQFLMRRGIFTRVVLYRGCRGDSVQGAISVTARLRDSRKMYAKAIYPKFRIVKSTSSMLPLRTTQGLDRKSTRLNSSH